MATYANFNSGPAIQDSSGPMCNRKFESDVLWPIGTNVTDGQTKDTLADGDHPVVAIGGLTTADGRPNNITGIVVSYNATSDIAVVNIAACQIVRAYVSNISLYGGEAPTAWKSAPIIGQPVYVDDSADLGAGCTLSMSAVNHAGIANPLAGHLMYCQDEYVDFPIGGANSTEWGPEWSDSVSEEHLMCVMLTNATP